MGAVLLLAGGRAAPAAAADLAWDAARCGALAVRPGRVTGHPGATAVAPWAVRLSRPDGDPGGHLRAARLVTGGPPGLDALAPLFAGGLLVGMERDRPAGCDLTHSFRNAAAELAGLAPGQTATETWTDIDAESGRSFASAETIRLEATRGGDGTVHLLSVVTGLSTAGHDMTAEPISRALVRVSLPHAEAARLASGAPPAPGDIVTIDDVSIESGDAQVHASGFLQPADRQGRLHVVATDWDAIKDALPVEQRTEAGAAFLMLRLAGRETANGATSWDVVLDDDHMTINGIPLPLP